PQEGLEPELLGVRELVQALDEVAVVLLEHRRVVVLVLDQVVEPLVERAEEDRVLVDVLEEVLPGGLAVLVELDVPVDVVEVQHRVERVVVHALLLYADTGDCRCQNRPNPSRTRVTSSGVPISSKPYR